MATPKTPKPKTEKTPENNGDERAARRSTPRRPLQERGRARFEALLDTVEAMLAENDPDQIGYYEIAERAGMPAATIYHFFPTKSAAFLALAERYLDHFRKAALQPINPGEIDSWQDFVRTGHQRAIEYYNAHPSAMKLILGAQPFLEIRSADSTANEDISRQLLEALRRAFHFPFIRDPEQKFLISLSISDAIWRVSFTQHGRITTDYAREATIASLAYMRTFLPERLEPRDASED